MAGPGITARQIVIVGAGFSGTVLAANLLRRAYGATLDITLLDTQAPAHGIAYAPRPHPFLLNVPAGRMSATSANPQEFLEFVRRTHPDAAAADYLPRALYGEYLEWLLREAQRAAPATARLSCVRGTVRSIERRAGAPLRVQLDDGRSLAADEVVVASGNPPPAALKGSEALADSQAYVHDPWRTAPRFRRGETVLLVGTGLTMADIALGAATDTGGDITLHALSRRGLLPRAQTAVVHGGFEADPRPLLHAAAFSLRRLVQQVRALAGQFEARGGDWREVITFVRQHAPALWQRLPERERRRFLRHVRTFWDVHRHRLPQQTLQPLAQLVARRALDVHAGRIVAMSPERDGVRVTWRPRGANATRSLYVDRVINCTGPDPDCRRNADPLLRALVAKGLALPCPLGLGLLTGAHGALLDAQGRSVPGLWYLGPLLRPDHWECTAAPELRGHAENLAQHLSGNISIQLSTQRIRIQHA